MTFKREYWLALSLVAAFTACSRQEPAKETSPDSSATPGAELSIYTVNYPLSYFAQGVGGDQVRVQFPAPADEDPAFWSPDAEAVSRFQQADLILLNGADYAGWTTRVTLPLAKLVDTSKTFADHLIVLEDASTHSHGPQGEHSHGETAFTTWLDPTLAVEHARAIKNKLAALRPEQAGAFEQGFEALALELAEWDGKLGTITRGHSERPLMGSHPVYQYLARRYSLNLRSVHFEPDEYPNDKAWSDLEKLLSVHPARWMLWEAEPLARTETKLRELGVQSVVFDPCGNTPAEGDYMSVMRANLERLARVFANGS